MSEADTIAATSRRLQRLEEDISILTGLLREVYDRVGSYPPPTPAPASSTPAAKQGPRRFRMRPQTHRLPRAIDQSTPPPAPEQQRYYGTDR